MGQRGHIQNKITFAVINELNKPPETSPGFSRRDGILAFANDNLDIAVRRIPQIQWTSPENPYSCHLPGRGGHPRPRTDRPRRCAAALASCAQPEMDNFTLINLRFFCSSQVAASRCSTKKRLGLVGTHVPLKLSKAMKLILEPPLGIQYRSLTMGPLPAVEDRSVSHNQHSCHKSPCVFDRWLK